MTTVTTTHVRARVRCGCGEQVTVLLMEHIEAGDVARDAIHEAEESHGWAHGMCPFCARQHEKDVAADARRKLEREEAA